MTATLQMKVKPAQKGFTALDIALLSFAAIFTVCLLFSWLTPGLHAEASLTEAFQTKSFRGSAEALTKANWIGTVLHYIISWFSFLGLCLTLYQKFITLLYLSARQLFDTIYEVKVTKMKGTAFGYGELIKGLFQNDRPDGGSAGGGGLDVFITFFYSLLPNVKAYSDFSPDRKGSAGLGWNKEKDDEIGVTQYMLKTAIPTVMLVFFLTIGYSGTLAKAYGTVVDGMAAAADQLVSQNLANMVNSAMGTMGGHTFQLDKLNTEAGKKANMAAVDMYSKILSKCSNLPDEIKEVLGQVIEDSVFGEGSLFVAPEGDGLGILGGQRSGGANERFSQIIYATAGSVSQELIDLSTDASYKNVATPSVYLSSAASSSVNAVVWDVEKLLKKAIENRTDLSATVPAADKYIHVYFKYNPAKATSYSVANPDGKFEVDTKNPDGLISGSDDDNENDDGPDVAKPTTEE